MLKSMRKSLCNLGLLLFVVGSLVATKTANAQWLLVNYKSRLCIGVDADVYQVGTNLIQWPCNEFDYSQNWLMGDITPPGAAGSTSGQEATTLLSVSFWQDPQFGQFVMGPSTVGALPPEPDPNGQATLNDQDGQVLLQREVTPTEGIQGWVFVSANKTIEFEGASVPCYYVENAAFTRAQWYNLGVSGGSTTQGAPIVTWVDSDAVTNHPDQIWCWAPSAL
jgi:hypothetical protein